MELCIMLRIGAVAMHALEITRERDHDPRRI